MKCYYQLLCFNQKRYITARELRNFHSKQISNHLRQFFYVTPNHVKGSNEPFKAKMPVGNALSLSVSR